MVKSHSKFTCQQCGYVSPQYLGKCPECGNWNSFVETVEQAAGIEHRVKGIGKETKPIKLSDIQSNINSRISTGMSELDLVLGGGLVPGQVVLLAGEPGVGKSTLLLQLARSIGEGKSRILYTSGEESVEQIHLRARRLGIAGHEADAITLMAETNVENIIQVVGSQLSDVSNKNRDNRKPITENRLLIVDSIQTMWTQDLTGAPGSVGQVRETAYRLIQYVKANRIPLIIVGQVTKEGSIAGPKVLEHLVDTVLYMEGMQYEETRLLRVTKNRFGPTDEIAVFTMKEDGLRQVSNPSERFVSARESNVAGQAVVVILEGSRPMLVEVQALVVPSELAIPRRVANGISNSRLSMICAVLAKYLRVPIGKFDVFVNVSGGFTIREPAADLGIAMAIFTSLKNKPLPSKSVCIGELSLLGEILPASQLTRRSREAKRIGYIHFFSSDRFSRLQTLTSQIG